MDRENALTIAARIASEVADRVAPEVLGDITVTFARFLMEQGATDNTERGIVQGDHFRDATGDMWVAQDSKTVANSTKGLLSFAEAEERFGPLTRVLVQQRQLRYRDYAGDIWTVDEDGVYCCATQPSGKLGSLSELINEYGPIVWAGD